MLCIVDDDFGDWLCSKIAMGICIDDEAFYLCVLAKRAYIIE